MKQNHTHKKKVANKKEVIKLVEEKRTIQEIANEVGITCGTIVKYLCELPKKYDISYLIDKEKEKEVLNYLDSVEWDKTKKSIKEAVSENIEYEDIILILAKNKIN